MIYEEISKNKFRSWLLIIVFVGFVLGLGWLFGKTAGYGWLGLALALIFSALASFGSYFYSDKLVLAISGAHPVSRAEEPYLDNVIEGLSIAAGLPKPRAYIIESEALNAFATGRNPENSALAVTRGLLKKLDRLELEGVVAHEMAHIANYDIKIATLAAVLVGTVVLLSEWFLRFFFWDDSDRDRGFSPFLGLLAFILALLAPLFATLIQLALSRKREYLADAEAARLTRYPEGLASALEKIARDSTPLASATSATAHLFIVNPFKKKNIFQNLFSTHPPVEERIARLRSM